MNDVQLARYLERIGHGWHVRKKLPTLRSLHRAHVTSIPFENLDVQLGEVPSLDPDAIYDKIVERGRGGWCYEMNGLFGAALQAIGFDVMRVSCGVMRQDGGNDRLGTHLALVVDCDGPWLCDVGFGGALLEPLPLAAGERDEKPYAVSLAQTEDGYWRFTERGPNGVTTHTIADADEFVTTLADRFGIDEPRARDIWPRIAARHRELFSEV
jgi:N-hydroxyarylamine O-acetyltransferase